MQVKIGAGLQVTSNDIECDQGIGQCSPSAGTVTKVARTDTGNGWYYNPSTPNCGNANRTGCWQPIYTTNSMPNGSAVASSNYNAPYELIVAPANTNIFYTIWGGDGCFYSSSDKGTTWTRGGNIIGSRCTRSDPNTSAKFFGPYIASDPHNANIVLATTPGSGASYSTNAGVSWTQITALGSGITPGGGNGGGGTIFAFDNHSWSSGNTTGAYACTYGVGVFHTTTGVSGSWAKLNSTGMPTTCRKIVVDNNGVLWILDDGSTRNIYSYNGSWQHEAPVSGYRWSTISVDTNNCSGTNSCHVVVVDDGGQYTYTTAGSGGFGRNVTQDQKNFPPSGFAATDQPWLARTNNNHWTTGGAMYDPSQSNVVEITTGIGYFYFSPSTSPSGGVFHATSLSAAMELGNINWMVAPAGGHPVVMEWDREGFALTNVNQYPPHTACNGSAGVVAGWAVDWVPSQPTTMVAMCNFFGVDQSGISSDGGQTWTGFPHHPAEVDSGNISGCITAQSSSYIMWQAGQGAGGPEISEDGGAHWTNVSPGGITAGWSGSFIGGPTMNCISDRVNGAFYAYNNNSGSDYVFKCTPPGCTTVGNWTQQCHQCAGGGNALFGGVGGVQIRSITGQAGTMFAIQGPSGAKLWKTTNGGATWSQISAITNTAAIGEGKGCNSDPYELYLYGGVTGVGTGFGLFQSGDGGKTWTQLGAAGLNNNLAISLDYIKSITGDNNTCGTVYIGSSSQGVVYNSAN